MNVPTQDDEFQVMPPLSAEEYNALKADIAEHGVRVPITVDQHGRILDGHNRAAIAAELNVPYDRLIQNCADDEEALDVAYRLNLVRRHLTSAQKRTLVATAIKARPSDSDRAIGRRVGCDHKTVAAVRSEISGEIPHARLKRLLEHPDYTPYEPHPVLELFPLVPIDQFAAIVRSIQRLGLLSPIAISHDRRTLVDGRIRLLACRAAHIEPAYKVLGSHYDEQKTLDYIWSANAIRKNHTPAEREEMERVVAEIEAKAYREFNLEALVVVD